MKIIFVNAPYFTHPKANAVNDFTTPHSLIDTLRTPHIYQNITGGGDYIIT